MQYINNLITILFYIGHNISNLLLIVNNKYKLKKKKILTEILCKHENV